MAARPVWKGFLKISLVTIPIKVFPATEASASLSFNQLHDTCQSRIAQKRWCPKCDTEVPSAEIVKGYEFEAGKYVILQPEELDAIAPPSTRVIDLVQFTDAVELLPQAIDRSYYLAPAGPMAAEAFAVVRIAMRHRVGIGKLAIYGREYLVAVRSTVVPAAGTYQDVLMLHTLHHAAERRPVEAIAELQDLAPAPSDQVKLAQQVIAALMGPLDLADFTDAYHADVRRLIDAKVAGDEIIIPPIASTPAVVNLRDALTQSLQAVRARGGFLVPPGFSKKPAKVPAVKRKRAS